MAATRCLLWTTDYRLLRPLQRTTLYRGKIIHLLREVLQIHGKRLEALEEVVYTDSQWPPSLNGLKRTTRPR